MPTAPASGSVTIDGLVVTTFAPATLSYTYGITAAVDGNMWFTDTGNDKIGKITPSGSLTEYPFLIGIPIKIASGPDGNLWIMDDFPPGEIVRYSPTTAAATAFPISSTAHPWDIVDGSDGNLWFTDSGTNAIGRITTAGHVTEFAVPDSNPYLDAIASGPDGDIWFSEDGPAKIGKVSTTGIFSASIGYPGAVTPDGITAGPDGNMWFIDHDANLVGNISLNMNKVTTFKLPSGYRARSRREHVVHRIRNGRW